MLMSGILDKKTNLSAIPGQTDPKSLLFSYQKKLLESLKIYLQKFSQSTKVDLSIPLNKIEQIDPHFRFSPALFGVYVHIKDAYQKKDVESVMDAIQDFLNLDIENHLYEHIYAPTLMYGSILSENWEKPFIKELRESTPQDGDGNHLLDKVQLYPLVNWDKNSFPPNEFKESETILKILEPNMFEEYSTYVSRIKLYSSKTLVSLSSPRFFGTIYLRLPNPDKDALLYYLEYIVHETSHLHLFVLMSEDPMVLNSSDEVFPSPLRVDLRPMMGIYHATFVLARIVRILKRYHQQYELKDLGVLKKQEQFFFQGLKTVGDFGKLSEQGKILYNSLQECAFEY